MSLTLKETLEEFVERVNDLPANEQERALEEFLRQYDGDDKELIEPDLWEMITVNGAFQ